MNDLRHLANIVATSVCWVVQLKSEMGVWGDLTVSDSEDGGLSNLRHFAFRHAYERLRLVKRVRFDTQVFDLCDES